MEYTGKLYGKVGGEYFPMEETTEDIDKLKDRIMELESKLKSMVSSSDVISSQRLQYNLFCLETEKQGMKKLTFEEYIEVG